MAAFFGVRQENLADEAANGITWLEYKHFTKRIPRSTWSLTSALDRRVPEMGKF